ncbi:MAG: hypothetical protein Q4D29_03170 [Lachnospiraceae bacterium]|nr:hypothetical protein [Lachnospiraceae bacterium]
MDKRIIAVCDDQVVYAERLCGFLEKQASSEWEIRLFSSKQMLVETLKNLQIDTLVVSDSYIDCINNISSNKLIILSEKLDTGLTYRYQSSKKIAEIIFDREQDSSIKRADNDLKNIKISVKNKVQEELLVTGKSDDNSTLKIIDSCIDNSSKLTYEEKNELRSSIFYSIRGLDVL